MVESATITASSSDARGVDPGHRRRRRAMAPGCRRARRAPHLFRGASAAAFAAVMLRPPLFRGAPDASSRASCPGPGAAGKLPVSQAP